MDSGILPFNHRVEPGRYRQSFSRVMKFDVDLEGSLVDHIWNEPDDLIQRGLVLNDCRRCTVSQFETPQGPVVIKRFNLRGPLHTIAHSVMRTRAQRGWEFGRLLRTHGIPSPRPLAYLERRVGPLRGRSYLVTQFVNATTLRRFVAEYADRDLPLELTNEFAKTWHRLRNLQLTHGDTKSTNFLVTKDLRLWLIDLDSMFRHRYSWTYRRAYKQDWQRFFKDWRSTPRVAERFRSPIQRVAPRKGHDLLTRLSFKPTSLAGD